MVKKEKRFILIDGPSASGKDSLISHLETKLRQRGVPVFSFSEETLDLNRQEIKTARDRGKQKGGTGDRDMAEALIVHRQQIYNTHVIPRLVRGETVIANRGLPATLVYQTARGEITKIEVWQRHENLHIPPPDLVVITHCSPQTAQTREEQRNQIDVGLGGTVTQESPTNPDATLKRRQTIHRGYQTVGQYLRRKGIPVLNLDSEKLTLDQELQRVLKRI